PTDRAVPGPVGALLRRSLESGASGALRTVAAEGCDRHLFAVGADAARPEQGPRRLGETATDRLRIGRSAERVLRRVQTATGPEAHRRAERAERARRRRRDR